ncbi:MAG TPA: 16S rRNA (guanine(966)-N(2))-methyltransferase RsmD, partial [Nitrosospira sp.]|nr:16S rRNA (guanine(966)-N(2))-methyltransferase RsmD [Nitrosospira sp.]
LVKNKVRIIAGEWRSRVLTFPDNTDVRPTPDRVRETVFNWLGQDMSGKCCLDLFAGSGAMGFEAASRGARKVVMVESSPGVMTTLRGSSLKLGASQVELVAMEASNFIDSDARRFDVIFLDPPYRLGLLPELLSKLHAHLASGGLVYVENDRLADAPAEWQVWRQGRAGKVFYQLLKSLKNGKSDLSGDF